MLDLLILGRYSPELLRTNLDSKRYEICHGDTSPLINLLLWGMLGCSAHCWLRNVLLQYISIRLLERRLHSIERRLRDHFGCYTRSRLLWRLRCSTDRWLQCLFSRRLSSRFLARSRWSFWICLLQGNRCFLLHSWDRGHQGGPPCLRFREGRGWNWCLRQQKLQRSISGSRVPWFDDGNCFRLTFFSRW